jgi:hypothetical protein
MGVICEVYVPIQAGFFNQPSEGRRGESGISSLTPELIWGSVTAAFMGCKDGSMARRSVRVE